jgi:hypothetical protein
VSEIPAAQLFRIDTCVSLVLGLGLVDPIQALPFEGRLLLLALESGELSRISRAFSSEAGYFALAGHRKKDHVEHLLSYAGEIAERSGSANAMGLAWLTKGLASFLRGEWKHTVERMGAAETTLRERCIGVAWELAAAHMLSGVSLFLMGEWKLLSRRLPRIIKDAEARGDLLEATDMRIRLAHTLCLAADDPRRAHEEIAAAVAEWKRTEFDLQYWWGWLGSIETDLYAGAAESAWRRVRREWGRLRWSFLMRVQYVYVESLHHRARAAIALAARETGRRRAGLLRQAECDAGRMQREGPRWSAALATLLEAGIAAVRGGTEQSILLVLEAAEQQLNSCDMSLYALAALRARGQLVGGPQGEQIRAAADQRMQDQEIRNPPAVAAMLAPGF